MRLPCSGEAVPLVLVITSDGNRERWVRHFGRRRLETVCHRLENERWLERFGLIELEFLARSDRNTIYHEQVRCRIVIGALSIPLPIMLSPSVEGVEEVMEDGFTAVRVVVAIPFGGKLIEYSGVIPAREGIWRSH